MSSSVKDYEKRMLKAYKESLEAILLELLSLFSNVPPEELTSSDLYKYGRNKKLFEQISHRLKDLGGLEVENLKDLLRDNYVQEYVKEIYRLNGIKVPEGILNIEEAKVQLEGMGVVTNFNSLNEKVIVQVVTHKWVGSNFSDRIWDNKRKLIRRMRRTLSTSLSMGESIPKITSRLQKELDSGYYNTVRLARTEVMRVRNDSKVKAYKDNDIEKLEWDSSPEQDRTCEVCAARNGKTYPIDHLPTMPAHPNCRCTWLPVLD